MTNRILLYITIVAMFLVLSNPASAFTVLQPEEFVGMDTVIDDDLYIFGDDVIIQGAVLGDVIACGGLVVISGNVTGDVMTCAGSVIINGNVDDDIRVCAGTLIVNGNVGGDLLVFGGNVVVSDDANIDGDVIFSSGQMELMSDVGGKIIGETGDITLAGEVDGNVNLEVDKLTVLPGTKINGVFTYTSPKQATIPPDTVIKDIDFIEKGLCEDDEQIIGIFSITLWFIHYLSLLVIGLLVLIILPNRTKAVARTIPDGVLMNLGMGFLLIIAGFVGSVLLFITVIGIPLGIMLLFMTFAVLYGAMLFFGFWLGNVIFSRLGVESKPWMDMVLGLFVLLILTSLPWIGFWIYLLVTFIAVGSLFIEKRRFYTEIKGKNML
ncbi:MAG: bactofilin family protein [Methanosarcinaceae archaeon]